MKHMGHCNCFIIAFASSGSLVVVARFALRSVSPLLLRLRPVSLLLLVTLLLLGSSSLLRPREGNCLSTAARTWHAMVAKSIDSHGALLLLSVMHTSAGPNVYLRWTRTLTEAEEPASVIL